MRGKAHAFPLIRLPALAAPDLLAPIKLLEDLWGPKRLRRLGQLEERRRLVYGFAPHPLGSEIPATAFRLRHG